MTDARIARLILYGWLTSLLGLLIATYADAAMHDGVASIRLAAVVTGWAAAGIVYFCFVTWAWRK